MNILDRRSFLKSSALQGARHTATLIRFEDNAWHQDFTGTLLKRVSQANCL